MKKILNIMLICVIISSFSACGNKQNIPQNSFSETETSISDSSSSESSTSESSSPESSAQDISSSRNQNTPSPALEEHNNFENLEVYRYFSEGKIYSYTSVDFTDKERTVLSVIDTAASALDFVKESLPIKSVTKEENLVTVDFEEDYIHSFSKYELDEISNTVAMTLMQNKIGDTYCFTLNGDKDILGGSFAPAELKLAEISAEECKKLTDTLPYEIYISDTEYVAPLYKSTFDKEPDKVETEIFHLLSAVGKIEGNAASPKELDAVQLQYSLINNTQSYYTDNSYQMGSRYGYAPQLIPITDSVSMKTAEKENLLWIADHIKQTAKLLYGDDFELDLSTWNSAKSGWTYFSQENVIVPLPRGGGYYTIPYIKDYKEENGTVTAEVIYLFESMGEISPWGEQKPYTPEEIKAYINSTDDIVNVTMKREKDGRLVFVSAQMN